MPMLSAAIEYAIAGWPVIPVTGKRPIEKDWPNRWSIKPEEIAAKKWPGIGLVTGILFFVVDIDGTEGWRSLVNALGGDEMPITPTAATARGMHYFFLMPKRGGIKTRAGLLPGIDIRAGGGYVVAAPSLHPSGVEYKWIIDYQEADLADAPPWLLKLFRGKQKPKKQYQQTSKQFDLEKIPIIHCGNRNDRLYRLACAAFANGKAAADVAQEMAWLNSNRCEEPVTERELDVIVKSASKHSR